MRAYMPKAHARQRIRQLDGVIALSHKMYEIIALQLHVVHERCASRNTIYSGPNRFSHKLLPNIPALVSPVAFQLLDEYFSMYIPETWQHIDAS